MEGGLGEIKTILDKVCSWDHQNLTLFETKSIHHSAELSSQNKVYKDLMSIGLIYLSQVAG